MIFYPVLKNSNTIQHKVCRVGQNYTDTVSIIIVSCILIPVIYILYILYILFFKRYAIPTLIEKIFI